MQSRKGHCGSAVLVLEQRRAKAICFAQTNSATDAESSKAVNAASVVQSRKGHCGSAVLVLEQRRAKAICFAQTNSATDAESSKQLIKQALCNPENGIAAAPF
ncbi:MAG: hypothetical protein RSD19_03305 [Oscillospiraceae bacterium]